MFALLTHWLARARVAHDRHRALESLLRLSDAQLRDVGLEPGTIGDHLRDRFPMQQLEIRPVAQMSPSLLGCG